jgi:erythromycin esterase
MLRRILAFAFAFSLRPCQVDAQSDSGFVAWARRTAIPIDSSERAVRSLDSAVATARLIGVGESVHDRQQFMELRFELLKDLVQHGRVTALVLESGLPEALAVDDYVQGRSASVDFASQLGPDYSESAVVRQAMQWLREWNRTTGKAHPVAVYGADISIGDGRSMLPALERLHAVVGNDPRIGAVLDSLRPIAARVAAAWWNGAVRNYGALPADAKKQLTELTTQLVAAAHAWRGGTPDQRAWAERFARIVQQDEVMLREGPFSAESPRDAAMAANTRWILDRLPSDERVLLWAHNAHVQRVPIKGGPVPPGAFPSMGYRLGKELGDAYFAIGTAYGGPSADSAGAPRAGSVDATLAAVSSTPFLLSLRGAPRSGAASAWLDAERPMRFQVGYITLPLAAAFDAVVYVDRVSPAVKPR